MLGLSKLALLGAMLAPALALPATSVTKTTSTETSVNTTPAKTPAAKAAGTSSFWMENIARSGSVAFGSADYKIFRNVKDYGAVG